MQSGMVRFKAVSMQEPPLRMATAEIVPDGWMPWYFSLAGVSTAAEMYSVKSRALNTQLIFSSLLSHMNVSNALPFDEQRGQSIKVEHEIDLLRGGVL